MARTYSITRTYTLPDSTEKADVHKMLDDATVGASGTLDDADITAFASAVRGDVLYRGASGFTKLNKGTQYQFLQIGANDPSWVTLTRVIEVVLDDGGGVLSTGIKLDLEIPFACTITQVTMLADQSGSMVVDIWNDTYANYPPTNADSITAAAVPTINATTKSQDSTLTGWTVAITAGDILRFNIDSCSTITRCTLALTVTPA